MATNGTTAAAAADKRTDHDYAALLAAADAAGKTAVDAATVVPMVVEQHVDMLDDASPVRRSWFVADGVCGFAWVTVRPGNSRFARYLKNHGWRTAYGGGVEFWGSAYGQSMQKKEAYANAYADVLRAAGFKAYAGSRMD